MSKNRIDIEQADNGYTISVWKNEEKEGEEVMYQEPKKLVATDKEEVIKIVTENL